MYCINCGADNLEAAKFCRKCGADLNGQGETGGWQDAVGGRAVFAEADGEAVVPIGEEAEVETRVARRDAAFDPMPNLQSPMDRVQSPMSNVQSPVDRVVGDAEEMELFSITPTLLFVKIGYAAAAFGALLLVAICSVLTSLTSFPLWMTILLGLILGSPLFLIPGFYHIRQKFVRYSLTESKLEIDKGFISRTTRNVPIRRIQDVTVTANLMQRLLGFGDLVIDNASEEGGKAVLKNINAPKHYADVLLRQMRLLDR